MPRKPALPVSPERDVLKAVLALLTLHKIPHFRNNTGAIPLEYKGKKRMFRAGAKDWPDVVAVLPMTFGENAGKALMVEVKRRGKRPTDGQMAVLRAINAAGGIGLWVDDVLVLEGALYRLKQGWRVDITPEGSVFVTDEPR